MPRAEPAYSLMDLYSEGSEDDMELNSSAQSENAAPARVPAQPSRAGRKGLMSATLKKAQGASGRSGGDVVLGPAKMSKRKVTKATRVPAAKRNTSREVLGERRSPNGSWEEDEDDRDGLGLVQSEADTLTRQAEEKMSTRAVKGTKRGKKGSAQEMDDEFDAAPLKKETKVVKRGRGKTNATEDDAHEETIAEPKKVGRARPKQANPFNRAVSPPQQPAVADSEPEPDPMDVELSIETDDFREPKPLPAKTASRAPVREQAQPPSSRQHSVITSRRRGASASDTERGATGAEMRRRLGETTKELEKLRLRYEDLRSIGVQDRESNFDRLKKTTDQREKDQNAIIASLRRQLEQQKNLAAEMKALQKEISTLKSTNSRITAENKSLASSLTESQNEAKSMSARLSALRAQSAEPPKITNGATKQRGGPSVSNSQPGFKDGDWQLKKDLFEDLTGLVVTNVKKSDGDIVYHCLQTGKNGALQFVLSHPQSPPAGDSWDEMLIEYDPQLDDATGRDATLLEILPDFLREGISFPRNQSTVFFARMLKYMNAGVQVVEQTEYSAGDDED